MNRPLVTTHAPAYGISHWQGALAAAVKSLAKPRPSRSTYSRGEFGEDCYQLALVHWQAEQYKAHCLRRLAISRLAVL